MSASVAMKVLELWRYPVKTMAGEMLERARIGPLGIEGDRIVHVEDATGHVVTSRSIPASSATGARWGQAASPWWMAVHGLLLR